MLIEIELVHAATGQRVVRARAIAAEGCLAMALGEGATAEEAEEKARSRLTAQLEAQTSGQPRRPGRLQSSAAAPVAPGQHAPGQPHAEQPAAPPEQAVESPVQEPQADPEDWSSELANLDLQLQRLGWSREQESTYLARAFGHGSRSRLTTYADLMAYLKVLEALPAGTEPERAGVPLKRSDLLGQCDQLLGQLGWDAGRGRQLLESKFGRSSRQQLSDSQLLEFNMLLEGELIAAGKAGAAG
jgi:hypothetical protein